MAGTYYFTLVNKGDGAADVYFNGSTRAHELDRYNKYLLFASSFERFSINVVPKDGAVFTGMYSDGSLTTPMTDFTGSQSQGGAPVCYVDVHTPEPTITPMIYLGTEPIYTVR